MFINILFYLQDLVLQDQIQLIHSIRWCGSNRQLHVAAILPSPTANVYSYCSYHNLVLALDNLLRPTAQGKYLCFSSVRSQGNQEQ